MAVSSAGFVTGLTAAALMTVGVLAYQASANLPAALGGHTRAGALSVAAGLKAPHDPRHPTALPDGSGTGERVVYSVDDARVWLVAEDGRVRRTFAVTPGTVDPVPGTYRVTSRSKAVTGTDGTPVEHVVRFADVEGVTIGFSAPVGGRPATAAPHARTGGIRATRADGAAMWAFAAIERKVVVVP